MQPALHRLADRHVLVLDLLPDTEGGVPLRHALEVRNPSFCVPEFIALARKHGAAVVFALAEAPIAITSRLYNGSSAEAGPAVGRARPGSTKGKNSSGTRSGYMYGLTPDGTLCSLR